MKKTIAFMLFVFIVLSTGLNVFAESEINNEAEKYEIDIPEIEVSSKSALLMNAETGEIVFAKNEEEAMAPASVTKIMTLLLVMEAIADGRVSVDSQVPISAYAASMGGSQVFLKEGESMTVRELIKCTVIASANDAAVALSEYVYGTEEAFVRAMNERASALGMKNTNFENTTGLDDTTANHVTSAKDIAIMSRELIKHPMVLEYSSLWQESIRNGEFMLTNTNRLVRYYDGCTGLKTGSTDKAGYCISATAKRDGMNLIAVVMGAETRDERNYIARSLLDYGFSNYSVFCEEESAVDNLKICGASVRCVTVYSTPVCVMINKKHKNKVEKHYELPESLTAPIKSGDSVGKVKYTIDGKILCESNIVVKCDLEKLSTKDLFMGIIRTVLTGNIDK